MSTRELTVAPAAAAPGPRRSAAWMLASRRARRLSWLSLAWMTVEGVVALLAGAAAGSVALIGFGLSSVVEGLASVIVIWRFTGSRTHSHMSEERAQKAVAISFFLLAPYIAVESAQKLVGGEHAATSAIGIALSASSVVLMPLLGRAKRRLGRQLGSGATAGEGTQNILCALMAGAVLLGLLGNALIGAWYLDPVAGLFIAFVAVREGREAWRGDSCCA